MKPASRIHTTIEILDTITKAPVPMDGAIGDYMRSRRYVGSKDRSNVVERVYGIMRAHARLSWWMERMKLDDGPRSRALLWVSLVEVRDAKRIIDLFDGSKYAPDVLSPQETKIVHKLVDQDFEHPDMPESVRAECPPHYEDTLRTFFGDAFEAEMGAMMQPATLDIRVNTFLKDKAVVKELLESDGVESDDTPYSPWGLRCRDKAYLSKSKAMQKGFISIQDEGSQLIVHLCDVKPGMQVLDYCAGGGGKTLALANAMQRKGRVVAMDIDGRRLERGRQRFRKAHLADIIEVRALSDEKNRKWLRRQKQSFDVTLLDVPCSGTGTWRRNPDLRWQHFGPTLEELLITQAEILDKVASTVKPGGKLVYATCSLLPEENEKQIERFLADHAEFELAPLDESLGLGHPYMRLTPLRHSTDGFFAAVLARKVD